MPTNHAEDEYKKLAVIFPSSVLLLHLMTSEPTRLEER
jgi:hypothetical protein